MAFAHTCTCILTCTFVSETFKIHDALSISLYLKQRYTVVACCNCLSKLNPEIVFVEVRVSMNAISRLSLRIFRRQLQHAIHVLVSPLRSSNTDRWMLCYHCSWYNARILAHVYTIRARMTCEWVTTEISEVSCHCFRFKHISKSMHVLCLIRYKRKSVSDMC